MTTLIVYSPCGHGHRSAARAIESALVARGEQVSVRDVLEFAPRAFRYDLAWGAIQRWGGPTWDWLFDVTDRETTLIRGLDVVRAEANRRLLAPLAAELASGDYDRIVCTHYMPSVLVARLKRAGRLRAHASTVVTDYLAHRTWVQPGIDRYYAATPSVADALVAHGAPSVMVSGLPIAAAMEVRPAPLPPLQRLRALVLVDGLPYDQAARAVASMAGAPAELDIVCGRDPERARVVISTGVEARIHGFTALKPLIDRAHVVVTKAGGLVVSECLARGRGMVLPWPAPGQERGNHAHAVNGGAALALVAPDDAGACLRSLAVSPERVAGMARAALRLAVRGAADAIATDLLGHARERLLAASSP